MAVRKSQVRPSQTELKKRMMARKGWGPLVASSSKERPTAAGKRPMEAMRRSDAQRGGGVFLGAGPGGGKGGGGGFLVRLLITAIILGAGTRLKGREIGTQRQLRRERNCVISTFSTASRATTTPPIPIAFSPRNKQRCLQRHLT